MSARRGGDMARTVTLPTLVHSSSNCWWYFLANLMNSRLPTSSPNLSRFWLMRGLILTRCVQVRIPLGLWLPRGYDVLTMDCGTCCVCPLLTVVFHNAVS